MADVTVRSRSYFRGLPEEGPDGMVSPGDVLTVTRQRAADLKANGLVETVVDAAPPEPDADALVDAASGATAPAPPKVSRRASS